MPSAIYTCLPWADLGDVDRQCWIAWQTADVDLRRAFLSPTFCDALAASGRDVRVIKIWLDGQAAAFLPLQRHEGWLGRIGVFEPVGGVLADYFGTVAGTEMDIDITAALRANSVVSAVWFTHLDASQTRFGLRGEAPRSGLRTRLPAPPEDFWTSLRQRDKKLVYDTERRQKRLVSEHGALTFEWQSATPEADLAQLIELKRQQYTRTEKHDAPLFDSAHCRVLEHLLARRDALCSGVLSVLRCEGRLVAAHFGLRCHDMLHIWFPVYDPAYAAYSPGRILMRHIFSAAVETGISVADRGEGDTSAKRDFANEEHLYYRGLWTAPGLRGSLAHLAVSLYWRLSR